MRINSNGLLFVLTPKQSLIIEHVQQHNTLTVSELTEKMNVTTSAVSQLLSKLEKEHYIERSINPNSRREIVVTLGLLVEVLIQVIICQKPQKVKTIIDLIVNKGAGRPFSNVANGTNQLKI